VVKLIGAKQATQKRMTRFDAMRYSSVAPSNDVVNIIVGGYTMNVVKVTFDGKRFVETVVARELSPSAARAKAQALNNERDSGREDSDESGIESYIAK